MTLYVKKFVEAAATCAQTKLDYTAVEDVSIFDFSGAVVPASRDESNLSAIVDAHACMLT